MNILIAGNSQFPFGSASASRLRHFALGLKEAGANVRVVSQVSIQNRDEDDQSDHTRAYRGIPYESVVGFNHIHTEERGYWTKLNWFREFIRGANLAVQRVAELIEKGQVDIILQYNRSHIAMAPFIKLCQRTNIPLVIDVVEWPDRSFFAGGLLHPFYWDTKIAMHYTIPKADGVIGISKFLVDFYSQKKMPVLRIPAVIEMPKQPPHIEQRHSEFFEIAYVGKLIPRDGITEILSAIKILLGKKLPVRLSIIGSEGLSGLGHRVKQKCKSDRLLKNSVRFLGYLSDDDLKIKLKEANALVFVRPNDVTAAAAFPTRLPEYLVTSRPVVAAGVGDIPEYLQDERDAILVSPCTPQNLAHKIEKLMQLPDKGAQIGLNGFQIAQQAFNAKTLTKEIYDFLKSFIVK